MALVAPRSDISDTFPMSAEQWIRTHEFLHASILGCVRYHCDTFTHTQTTQTNNNDENDSRTSPRSLIQKGNYRGKKQHSNFQHLQFIYLA